jgi:FecR protein/Glucodextranase, domain B
MNANAASFHNFDDAFVERLLVASGRAVRPLSAARRERILSALLTENTRLAHMRATIARRVAIAPAPIYDEPGESWWDVLTGLFTSKLVRPLAGVTALMLCFTAYVIFLGTPGGSAATLSGRAVVSEARSGLGQTWRLTRGEHLHADAALRKGDEVLAVSPITITFADGTSTAALAGSRLIVLDNGAGVRLLSGAIESRVTPRKQGEPRFLIESAAGLITVKGTVFRVAVNDTAGAMDIATDEGVVEASNDRQRVDVSAGEQLRIARGQPLITELQVPRMSFGRQPQGRVVTNRSQVPFTANIVANGTLVAIDNSGAEVARFPANTQGRIDSAIQLREQGLTRLRFVQEGLDKRRSRLSEALEIDYNQSAFTLRLNPLTREGGRISLSGITDPSSKLTVDNRSVAIGSDGSFSVTLSIADGQRQINITSIDANGNATTVLQVVE